MVAFDLTGSGVHAVRRRRQQQCPGLASRVGIPIVEQLSGQLRGGVLGVGLQKVLEPLELVEHDEIGAERVKADVGHDVADLADQLTAPGPQSRRQPTLPFQPIDKLVEQAAESHLAPSLPGLVRFCEPLSELTDGSLDQRSVLPFLPSEPLIAVLGIDAMPKDAAR